MQILTILDGNYSIKHNGSCYMRYTDFDDVPYYISDSENDDEENHYTSNEELEIEFQREIKRIERLEKLERICK